jgi:hypothetical protein
VTSAGTDEPSGPEAWTAELTEEQGQDHAVLALPPLQAALLLHEANDTDLHQVGAFGIGGQAPGTQPWAVRAAVEQVEDHDAGVGEQSALMLADVVVDEPVEAGAVPQAVVGGVLRLTGP